MPVELIGEDPGGPAAGPRVRDLRVPRRSRPCRAPGCPAAATPRPPRARRSWTDRRAGRPGARPTRPAPAGPGRPRPPRGPAARDDRATVQMARANRSPVRLGDVPEVFQVVERVDQANQCGASAPARRRGCPIRARALRRAETPRPAPSRHNASRASACGSSRAWWSGTSRRNLAAGPASSAMPWRGPDGRAAGRSGARSRQADRSCRPRSGPGRCRPRASRRRRFEAKAAHRSRA